MQASTHNLVSALFRSALGIKGKHCLTVIETGAAPETRTPGAHYKGTANEQDLRQHARYGVSMDGAQSRHRDNPVGRPEREAGEQRGPAERRRHERRELHGGDGERKAERSLKGKQGTGLLGR
jgi:hypothetical protein